MEINKANFSTNGSRIDISVPFSKVNADQRTVSGFATLDNIDRQGDLVLASASTAAFEAFRGNLREMHQNIAVGKVLSFTQEEFFDKESGKMYNGVYVTAYISKGAQDTWEKVLDGTLSGFSIGGAIVDAESFFDPEIEKTIRIIKDYSLVELSLVDSPANQLANVFAITKSDTGELEISGIAVVKTTNVFWCHSDQIAKTSDEESLSCSCGKAMENIGWIEQADTNKSDSIAEVVNRFLSESKDQEISKGGNEMADNEIVDGTDEVSNEAVVETEAVEAEAVEEVAEAADETVADEVEKAETVSEVEDADVDLVKQIAELKEFVASEIAKAIQTTADQVAEVTQTVEAIVSKADAIEADLSDIKKSFDSTVGDVNSKFEEIGKSVNALDSAVAIKKSEDLGGSEVSVERPDSIWRGSFLSVSDL